MPNKITITLSGIPVQITRKKVKNINLRVYPAKREVRISAPRHLPLKTIRRFAESKQDWIQKHFKNYKSRRPINPDYTDGETHHYQGKKLQLQVNEHHAPPDMKLYKKDNVLEMFVRPGSDKNKRARVLKEWYRARLKEQIPVLIEKWESPMGVSVQEFGVKQMKTRWGSCNVRDRRIWLNLELAKKSPACLEYVVVHEMVHLLERNHTKRFYRLMEQFLPDWKATEKVLQGKVD